MSERDESESILKDISELIQKDAQFLDNPLKLAFSIINSLHEKQKSTIEQPKELFVDQYILPPYKDDRFKVQSEGYVEHNILQTSATQAFSFLIKERVSCLGCHLQRTYYRQLNCLSLMIDGAHFSAIELQELLDMKLEDHKVYY